MTSMLNSILKRPSQNQSQYQLVHNPDFPVINQNGELVEQVERQRREYLRPQSLEENKEYHKQLRATERLMEAARLGQELPPRRRHQKDRRRSLVPLSDKFPQNLRNMTTLQLPYTGSERLNRSDYDSETDSDEEENTMFPTRRDRPAEQQEPDDSYPMRHGWDAQYRAEQLAQLATSFYLYYNDKRHERPRDHTLLPPENLSLDWRMKDRLKTVHALIILCLNIGIDPPDVLKIAQPARIECWIDPMTCTSPSGGNIAITQIAKAIEKQYIQLSIRTKYKVVTDPGMEDVKKLAQHARRQAKDERVLFHYNGHGVPKPTSSGEIWVFNRDFTQYIPVPLYELQNWVAAPSLYLWDLNNAELVVQNFNEMARRHESENELVRKRDPDAVLRNFSDTIHLISCRADENLPQTPLAPADLFTSCLTTPIEMAIRFFVWRQPLCKMKPDDAVKVPGKAQERRTPMGELNWIFTAITDTIAWNTLPRPLFKKLFRQDLMVAALFRNFLLAQRVMHKFGLHPMSQPAIPDTHDHHLWESWDFAVELVLQQLPKLKAAEEGKESYEYSNSEFFSQQLTAFELYLEDEANHQEEPEQLPVVLQVLLSQVHRLRALILLSRFLDNGSWAVELALNIGIFPYVLKLLQSQAVELKPPLVFIWTRIMAVDQACQTDLVKDNGYTYFISILQPRAGLPVRDVNEHRAMCAFILATFVRRFRPTQDAALNSDLMSLCLDHLSIKNTEHPLLRQWSCLCLGNMWEGFPDAKWIAITMDAHLRVCELALDPVPEVRASMLYAMSTFMDVAFQNNDAVELESFIALKLLPMAEDGSNLVRKELTVFLSVFVARHVDRFTAAAAELIRVESLARVQELIEEVKGRPSLPRRSSTKDTPRGIRFARDNPRPVSSSVSPSATVREHFSSSSLGSNKDGVPTHNISKIFWTTWKQIEYMSLDPDVDVAKNASAIIDFVEKRIATSSQIHLLQKLVGNLNAKITPKKKTKTQKLASRASAPLLSAQKRSPLATPAIRRDGPGYFSRTPSNNAAPTRQTLVSRTRPATREKTNTPLTPSTPLGAHPPSTPNGEQSQVGRWPSNRIPGVESFLYDDQRVYFTEPQMRAPEADLHGSPAFNERLMQQVMVEATLSRTQTMKEEAGSTRWDTPYGQVDNKGQPHLLTAHQFQNHLAVAERGGIIRIFDYEKHKLLDTFHNGNLSGSQVTGVKFINEDFITPNVIVGTDDGVIRIHSAYEDSTNHRVAATFRASPDSTPTGFWKKSDVFSYGQRTSGTFVFDFVQATGKLFAVGNSRDIQIWDTGREMTSHDIALGTSAGAKSITTDQVTGGTIAVGFWDGSIRIYDQRSGLVVRKFGEHEASITNLHFQRGGQRELASGSRDGVVKTWDTRQDKSLLTVQAGVKGEVMDCFIVHEHDPVFAVGTHTSQIRIHNITTGAFINAWSPPPTLRKTTPLRSPIHALAFHPHKTVLFSAQQHSGIVSMFTCNEDKYRDLQAANLRRLVRAAQAAKSR